MTRDRFTGPARSPFNVSSAIKWKNTSGGTIPAYGVIKLSGYDAIGDYFNAVKPDGEGNLHFVNGPVAVVANAYGGSQLWNHSRIGKTSSTTFGATVGPVADSWEMEETGSGFVTFSDPSGGVAAILQVGGGGGSDNHIHGIVVYSWGCGYYDVQLAEWSGTTPDEQSSQPSASSSPNECDICDELIDGSGGACATDQTLPAYEETEDDSTPHIVRRQVVGLVDDEDRPIIVLARHRASQFIPLQLWSDCLLTDLGDENETIGSSSGSGSASSGTTEPVYQIVDGLLEHVIKYEKRWKCCNGVDTLMGRTPIIFAAKVCPEEICSVCE